MDNYRENKKKLKKKEVYLKLCGVVLASSLMVSNASMVFGAASVVVNGETKSIIPGSISVSSPKKLSEIELPKSSLGSIKWADSSQKPSKYSNTYQVIFTPAAGVGVDFSEVDGWDAETGTVKGSITVYVTSLKPAETPKPTETPEADDKHSEDDLEHSEMIPIETPSEDKDESKDEAEDSKEESKDESKDEAEDSKEESKDESKDEAEDSKEEGKEESKDEAEDSKEEGKEESKDEAEDSKEENKDESKDEAEDSKEEGKEESKDEAEDSKEEGKEESKDEAEDSKEESKDESKEDAEDSKEEDKDESKEDAEDSKEENKDEGEKEPEQPIDSENKEDSEPEDDKSEGILEEEAVGEEQVEAVVLALLEEDEVDLPEEETAEDTVVMVRSDSRIAGSRPIVGGDIADDVYESGNKPNKPAVSTPKVTTTPKAPENKNNGNYNSNSNTSNTGKSNSSSQKNSSDTNKRFGVATGDTTKVMPYILTGLGAGAALVLGAVAKMRKKHPAVSEAEKTEE